MPKNGSRRSSPYSSRRRWKPADAEAVLAALDASGLTLSAFAVREGLDPQRLTRWRRQLESSASRKAPVFEEVFHPKILALRSDEALAVTEHGRFEIVLSSGRVVRVPASFDGSVLRRLLEIVEEVRAC